MTGSVFHIFDHTFIFPENLKQFLHNPDIFSFAISSYAVCFPDGATMDNEIDSLAMIFDIQPITHIESIAIHRNFLATLEKIRNDERYEFFRMCKRSIIIGTVGNRHRKIVGMKIRTNEMIRGCLGSAVRAPRVILGILIEWGVFRSQGAKYLVRGDMVEAFVMLAS